jgi:hypothetical protein
MPTHTLLTATNRVGDYQLGQQLELNLQYFLDWGLLNAGNFYNVNSPASGAYGGDYSRMRMSSDPSYSGGQVWEGARQQWVWESGLEFSSQPIRVSGVLVNGSLKTPTTSGYTHYIDYPRGRVVFDSPLPSNSVVKCNHSFKWTNIYSASSPYSATLMTDSFRVDNTFGLAGSGLYDVPQENRVQLPAIVVESVGQRISRPYQLGGSQEVEYSVLCHVYAEDKWARDNIVDILANQREKTIYLFDANKMASSGAFPLNSDGGLTSRPLCYPDLVSDNYFWRRCRIAETVPQVNQELEAGNLHRGVVRFRCSVVMAELV